MNPEKSIHLRWLQALASRYALTSASTGYPWRSEFPEARGAGVDLHLSRAEDMFALSHERGVRVMGTHWSVNPGRWASLHVSMHLRIPMGRARCHASVIVVALLSCDEAGIDRAAAMGAPIVTLTEMDAAIPEPDPPPPPPKPADPMACGYVLCKGVCTIDHGEGYLRCDVCGAL